MAYSFNEARRREVPDDLLRELRQGVCWAGSDLKRAKAALKEVTSPIFGFLQQRDLVLRPEFVGGSFEGTKTWISDFDVLVILDGRDLIAEEKSPQFSTLRPRKLDNQLFSEFLTREGLVDPRKVISKLQSWIRCAINLHPSFGNQGDCNVQVCLGGPAITLVIQRKPNFVNQSIGTMIIDLVPAFEVAGLYFVAKPCRQAVLGPAGTNKDMLWRKSFSLCEKQQLKYIDRDGGCRRECVKILKCLRQGDSPLKYLASYHYKVLVLKECERYPKSEDWAADRLAERLWRALESLERYLEIGRLPHVFDPRINTFDTVSNKTALENTRDRVRRLLNRGSTGIIQILGRSISNHVPTM